MCECFFSSFFFFFFFLLLLFLVVFSFGEYLLSVCIVLVYCSDFGICFLKVSYDVQRRHRVIFLIFNFFLITRHCALKELLLQLKKTTTKN